MSRLPFTLLAALPLTGCIPLPFPVTVYESDTPGSTPVYAQCTMNKHVPDGIRVRTQGVTVIVQVVTGVRGGDAANPDRITLRLDVPAGHSVRFVDGQLTLDRRDAGAPQRARFPAVSRVDMPRSGEVLPALQRYQLPIDAPLPGATARTGTYEWDRHYWLVAPVDLRAARELTLTLPAFTVDGEASTLPPLHLRRRTSVALALFNC